MTDITNKAMLVQVYMSTWTGKIVDKAVTQETNERNKADKDAGKYTKNLLPKEALAKIVTSNGKVKKFRDKHSMPWNSAYRIMPAKIHFDFMQGIGELMQERKKFVNELCIEYPRFVRNREQTLGTMFDRDEYPDVTELPDRYRVEVDIQPVPTAGDFRVDLSQGEVEKIRRNVEERLQASTARAMNDLWERLYKSVKRMSDTLNIPDQGFQSTMIGNIQELVDLLPKLNLTDDPKLEDMRRAVEVKLCGYKDRDIKEDKGVRKEAAKSADDILAAMAGYVGQEAA